MSEINRINEAIINGLVKKINSGDPFVFEYKDKINCSDLLNQAWSSLDKEEIKKQLIINLEKEVAKQIVNKMHEEISTDIKKNLCNTVIRDDIRFELRKMMEKLIKGVEKNE